VLQPCRLAELALHMALPRTDVRAMLLCASAAPRADVPLLESQLQSLIVPTVGIIDAGGTLPIDPSPSAMCTLSQRAPGHVVANTRIALCVPSQTHLRVVAHCTFTRCTKNGAKSFDWAFSDVVAPSEDMPVRYKMKPSWKRAVPYTFRDTIVSNALQCSSCVFCTLLHQLSLVIVVTSSSCNFY
jgi:hypothetical protein